MSSERFEDLEDELRSTLGSLESVIRNRLPKISGGKVSVQILYTFRMSPSLVLYLLRA